MNQPTLATSISPAAITQARHPIRATIRTTVAELVVLIRRGDLILGQIDVDSDVPDPFDREEEAEVRQVADALAVLL